MLNKWRLQECGFNQAAFSTQPDSQAKAEGSVRTLCSFGNEPRSVTASSMWDACYVFAELITKETWTVTLGRWQGLLEMVEGQILAGDKVTKVMEVGEKVLFRTMKKKVLIKDGEINQVSVLLGLSACVQSSHLVRDKLCVLCDDGSVHFSPVNSNPLIGDSYPFGLTVKEVACGSDHLLLLEEERGRLWSLGLNHRGQLGHGDVLQRTEPFLIEALDGLKITAISCGQWHNLVLSEYGDLYSWGWNAHNQLGHSSDSPTITIPCLVELNETDVFCSVSCGTRHSAALTMCGKLFTWGWNAYGQLGHSEEKGPAEVCLADDMKITWIYCGSWNTIFISKSDT